MDQTKRLKSKYATFTTCAYLLFLLGWLTPVQVSHAQFNYKDGLVITHSGDSLHGQIDDREWIQNPDVIRFRRNEASKDQIFTPLDLKAFYISGRRYKGAIVTVDETPLRVDSGLMEITPSTRKDTVFMTVLVKGPLNLYYHKDQRDHFYLENSSGLIELISHEFTLRRGHSYFVVTDEIRKYANQIKRFVMGCPKAKEQKLRYSKKSFIKFVTNCNRQAEPLVSQYVHEVKRSAFGSQVFFGVSRSSFKLKFGNTSIPFTPARDVTFGYSAVWTLPGARDRRSVFASLQYHRFESRYRETYINQWITGNTVVNEVAEAMAVNVKYLKLAAGYRYQILSGRVRPFLSIGAFGAKRLGYSSTGHYRIEQYSFEGEMPDPENLELVGYYSESGEILIPFNLTGGVFAGAGISYGRLTVALRSETGFFSSNSNWLHTTYLTAGFSLWN